MQLKWSVLLPVACIFLVIGCFDNAPSYSVVPSIQFSSLCFIDSKKEGDADTLVLSLKFKDGDGDLGLSGADPADSEAPYNEKFYFQKKPDGTVLKVTSKLTTSMLNYKDKRTNLLYDTLPSFVQPYSCTRWEVIKDSNTASPKILDTLSVLYNPNFYNIRIDIYTKNFDGSFTKFDWNKFNGYPNCPVPPDFSGRFPVLSVDPSKKSPLEGILTYNLVRSEILKIIFKPNILKLKITITDRALNRSNELETPEFTLQSITCN
jgi:hypothetical protein